MDQNQNHGRQNTLVLDVMARTALRRLNGQELMIWQEGFHPVQSVGAKLLFINHHKKTKALRRVLFLCLIQSSA